MRKTWICALAIPLALAGFASPASAKTPKAPKPPKTPPNEQITITYDAANLQAPGAVVATGPISGNGTATSKKVRRLGQAHLTTEVLTFSTGTVAVKAVLGRSHRSKADPATCSATVKGKGAWNIRRGTGAYATAKGRGHFTVTGTVVGTHVTGQRHPCSFKTQTGSIVVTASGNVKL